MEANFEKKVRQRIKLQNGENRNRKQLSQVEKLPNLKNRIP